MLYEIQYITMHTVSNVKPLFIIVIRRHKSVPGSYNAMFGRGGVCFRHPDPEIGLIGNAVPEPSGWSDDIVDSRNGTGGFNGKLFRF